MKSILKKNQIIISAIAIMLIAAGYMSYTTNTKNSLQTAALADTEQYAELGDATLVSANITQDESQNVENEELDENNIVNYINTSSSVSENQYVVEARLERDTMYSEMLESYQKILDSTTTSSKQKEEAQKEITIINNTKNAIMITENLIKTKGFEDCIVFSNDDSVNAVIKKEKLTKEDTAQIQSIIAREMNSKLENIHIMTK